MEEAELRRRVAEILAAEEQRDPDWARVETLCAALDEQLRHERETVCADSVSHFLDDADIRQRDDNYAAWQRDLERRYVETGEMTEHARSIPLLGCLLFVAAGVELIIAAT
jgi:hypothetical protein